MSSGAKIALALGGVAVLGLGFYVYQTGQQAKAAAAAAAKAAAGSSPNKESTADKVIGIAAKGVALAGSISKLWSK